MLAPISVGNPKPSATVRFIRWSTFVVVAIGLGFAWWNREELSKTIQTLTASKEASTKEKGTGDAIGRKGGGRPVPVGVATAYSKNVNLYLNGLGTVTAFNTVTVKSRVDGELTKVGFQEGEKVQAGDLIAELDSRPFEAVLAQAQSQLTRDQATLELSRLTLGRLSALVLRDATSQQEFDEQNALVKQSQAVVDIDRANVDNAKLQLSYTKIMAPITGRVGLRLVDKGNIVKANDLGGLVVITQLQPISVIFTIPQDEIPRLQLRIAKDGELSVDAFAIRN